MFETECAVNQFLLTYIEGLLQDIPEERMAEQPAPGVNHPAWILGHLAWTADSVTGMLGGEKTLSPEWGAKYGQNSEPTTQRDDYPSKAELLETLNSRFAAAREQAAQVNPEALDGPNPIERMRAGLPKARDLAAFILAGHLGIHTGQLSTWRRLMGSSRLF